MVSSVMHVRATLVVTTSMVEDRVQERGAATEGRPYVKCVKP